MYVRYIISVDNMYIIKRKGCDNRVITYVIVYKDKRIRHKLHNLDSLLLLHKGEGIVGFNASNISVISWRSVLLMDELEVPGEKYQPVASH